LDLFHALVDLGLGSGSFSDGLSRSVWVELVSPGKGGLVDPVSADGFAEDVESGMVVFRDHVGMVGIAASGHRCVDATAVRWAVHEEKGDIDGAALAGVAGLGVTQLNVAGHILCREADASGGPGDSDAAVAVNVGDGPVVPVLHHEVPVGS